MANLFPDLYPDRYSRKPHKFQTRVVTPTGLVQINATTQVDQYTFDLGYAMLSAVQLDQIVAHHKANSADDTGFSFYDAWSRAIPMMAGAVGNGSVGPYILPVKLGAGYAYQINGVATAGTLNVGAGAEGEDGVTFAAVVANGATISFSVTAGRRKFTALWLTEEIEERHIEADVWGVDLQLVQRLA